MSDNAPCSDLDDLAPELDGDAKTSLREDILWVYDHLGTPDGEIDYASAPGGGAQWLVGVARKEPSRFLSLLEKVLPAAPNVQDRGFSDDGSDLCRTIDKIRASTLALHDYGRPPSILQTRPQVPGGKPSVPPEPH